FLNATRGLEVDPAKAARTPKLERKLPDYLDRGEIDLLFEEAERRAAAGGFREGRDLAMLELFYSTGIRLGELARLNEQDVDVVSDQLKVRGKGKKERIVPVGKHAGRALRRYYRLRDAVLAETRQERRALFVSRRGKRLTPRALQPAIKRLLRALAPRATAEGGGGGAGRGDPLSRREGGKGGEEEKRRERDGSGAATTIPQHHDSLRPARRARGPGRRRPGHAGRHGDEGEREQGAGVEGRQDPRRLRGRVRRRVHAVREVRGETRALPRQPAARRRGAGQGLALRPRAPASRGAAGRGRQGARLRHLGLGRAD